MFIESIGEQAMSIDRWRFTPQETKGIDLVEDQLSGDWVCYDDHTKELEAKEKENQQLRLALMDSIGAVAYIRDFHGELYGVGFDRVESYRELAKDNKHD